MSSFYSSSTLSVSVKNLLWLILTPTTRRIQIVTEGKKRKLIIKDCKIDDTANITVKVPGDESSAPLKVARKSTNTDLDTNFSSFIFDKGFPSFQYFGIGTTPFLLFQKHCLFFLTTFCSFCTASAPQGLSIYSLFTHSPPIQNKHGPLHSSTQA